MQQDTILSIIFGGLITIVASWIFFKWSGNQLTNELNKLNEELKTEVDRLRRTTILTLNVLENAGLAELARDEAGNPTGRVVNLSGTATGTLSASAHLSVKQSDIDT